MAVRSLSTPPLLAAVLFVASTLVLAVQLITPTPVMVSVGENSTNVAELGGYFSYRDVGIVAIAAAMVGASGSYLLFVDHSSPRPDVSQSVATADDELEPSDELLEARRQEWEETAKRLAENERAIYESVLEADGVLAQAAVVEETELSKATVSRLLDRLESKNLLERKRRGMGNVILLL